MPIAASSLSSVAPLWNLSTAAGTINSAPEGSGDAGPLAVENEHVTAGECADVSSPSVPAQELDFQAIGREQLDDGSHVARMDIGCARAVEHGHHVQQFQLSRLGQVNHPLAGWQVGEYSR